MLGEVLLRLGEMSAVYGEAGLDCAKHLMLTT